MTHAPSTSTRVGPTFGRRTFLGGVSAVGAGVAMASMPVLYGGIEAVINGMDSSRASENLAAAGVSSNVASARMTRPQYLQRAQEFYAAGYDGIYIFNNPSGAHSLGRLGDKVAVAQWAAFARPTETVRETITLL